MGRYQNLRLAAIVAADLRKELIVMAKCDICGKGPQFGHNVSHSHKKTKRQWKPNIQKVAITEGNVTKRLNVCAKCLKTKNRMR